jgi:hypothetical protein
VNRAMSWCAVAAVVCAFVPSVSGQINGGVVHGGAVHTPGLSRQERIAQVVAEVNARAVPAKPGPSVTGGEPVVNGGPAAWTMVNEARALVGCSVDVALVFADSDFFADDVVSKLSGDPRIASITSIDATSVTPEVDDLLLFDAVMVWSSAAFLDPVALGNELAAYVDAGGGLVLGQFAMNEVPGFPNITPRGRFLTDNYYCIERDTVSYIFTPATLGTVHVPGSPLMQGVTSFDGGDAFRPGTDVHPNATRVASWSTGEVLVATRFDLAGRRVDLGFYPPSATVQSNLWVPTTDGDLLMANALVYAGGCPDVGLEGCEPSLYVQEPTVSIGAYSSNTEPNSFSLQQVADDFVFAGGATVHRVIVWGGYFGDRTVAKAQRMVINIHSNTANLPGSIIYTETKVVTPEYTGFVQGLGIRLYRFSFNLETPFIAAPGVKYWLSPLGDLSDKSWIWQRNSAAGEIAARSSEAFAWDSYSQGMAFELCGVCDCNCPGDADFFGTSCR